MTTFYDWLYLGQTQYDPDDLNKREKELAQLAWEEAQPTIPEGWKLVPVEPTHRMLTQMLCGSATPEANYTDFWERRYQAMLAAAPNFGEEE